MKRNVILGSALLALVLGSGVRAATAQIITEFGIFTIDSKPSGIVAGPDGNLWFTESQGNKIGRITPAGILTEFPIPTPGSGPAGIAVGPDGNLWFTESASRKIGQITPAGVITEFPFPFSYAPHGIAAGPDGNLWFIEALRFPFPVFNRGRIGRITPAGVVTEFALLVTAPGGIAAGPDGNLWFTGGNQIGRITPEGDITEFSNGGGGGIAAGPDGNLWFTGGHVIGRITTAGVVTRFAIPSGDAGDIAAGPDGNLWFTDLPSNRIGRITPAGAVAEFAIPTPVSFPAGIAAGPDGALWFTESNYNKIGRITTSGGTGTCVPDEESLCLSGGRFQATATYRNQHTFGIARAVGISDSSGFFTFDNPDSVELVVKVLNACSFTPNIWVFAAGLTDQEVLLTVTDTKTGANQIYSNSLGTTFVTVTDTTAFSTCP